MGVLQKRVLHGAPRNLLLLYRGPISMLIFLVTPRVALYGIDSLAQLANDSALSVRVR